MTRQIIPLETLARRTPAPTHGGECNTARCGGSSASATTLPAAVWDKVKDHPCYSEQAHHYFARMHVAVAPACNIQCNYCNRKYDCVNESRPGVTSERLTPEQAAHKVAAVAAKMPQLSVLGIAGPGDALADWQHTFATFDLVAARYPDLKLCLSTNGLALPDHIASIKAMKVDHVTITINMVDPAIGAHIYAWVFYDHARRTGLEAARILHERQIEGLRKLVEAGILVKVNSVLIPGVNDHHLLEVNEVVRGHGAFLHNVMPLISDPAHGTAFGLAGQRGPTAHELKTLQDRLSGDAKLMKHCRQCRADAVGLLGEDLSQQFTLDRLDTAPPPPPTIDEAETRRAYRDLVERERADRAAATRTAERGLGATAANRRLLIAVCTKGGGRINQHFGHAGEFQIYEVDRTGIRFSGHRRADHYCQGGYGADEKLTATIKALDGVCAVLCARIGQCPSDALAKAGITPITDYAYDYIETAVGAVFRSHLGVDAAPEPRAAHAS